MEEEEKEGRFKRRRMMEQRPGCMRRPCSGGAATGTSRRFLRRRGAGEWLPDARPVSWSSLVGRFMKLDNQLGFFTPESPFGSGRWYVNDDDELCNCPAKWSYGRLGSANGGRLYTGWSIRLFTTLC